jgi:hypothetical protein
MQLSGRYINGRSLVIGRAVDYSSIGDLQPYFDIVIAEDTSFANESTDISIWQPGSPYVGGQWVFPEESDQLLVVNLLALRKMISSNMSKRTYNLAFLPGGDVAATPGVVKGLPIGLDALASGVHLARIMGCTEIYDTESRSGTQPGMPGDILSKISSRNSLGASTFYKSPRFSLLEQL